MLQLPPLAVKKNPPGHERDGGKIEGVLTVNYCGGVEKAVRSAQMGGKGTKRVSKDGEKPRDCGS